MALDEFAGFGIRGYRSFGHPDFARFGPMSKVHLVVGRNNVGKSNSLRFVTDTLAAIRTGNAPLNAMYPGTLDLPDDWRGGERRGVSIALRLSDQVRTHLRIDGNNAALEEWLTSDAYIRDKDTIWFDLDVIETSDRGHLRLSEAQATMAEQMGKLSFGNLPNISGSLSHGSGDTSYNLDQIGGVLAPWAFVPPIKWVDSNRQLTASRTADDQNSPDGYADGRGLIWDLGKLQNPAHINYRADTARWQALQQFIRDVLEDSTARIQIPDEKDTILVHQSSGVKPLEKVGTGLSELIFLAAVTTSVAGHLICLEEPELHLHPTLQRKLVAYLHDSTDNRYLVSTHSAALLNSDVISVTHLEMEDSSTRAKELTSPHLVAAAVSDLGNRASDLVQSSFVVWVEGPSDRTYVVHWLRMVDPDLRLDAHYSVMFYGGSMLNHLSASEPSMDRFIALLRINRNLAVVMDSDRQSATAPLTATKQRVIKELEEINALAWVTSGYTIENYIPRTALKAAVESAHSPERTYAVPESAYRSPLGAKFAGTSIAPDKVRIAAAIVLQQIPEHEWPTDLIEVVQDLSKRIRIANGLPSTTGRHPEG